MRLRCLIADPNEMDRMRFYAFLRQIQGIEIYTASTFVETAALIESHQPNFIYLRCDAKNDFYLRVFKMIKRLKLQTIVVPIISNVTEELLKNLVVHHGVADVVRVDADDSRVMKPVQKALNSLGGKQDRQKYYRGFISFVGITPTLRERKILNQARLGILHNNSIRLAIEYWRKNPNSQMIVLSIKKFDSLSGGAGEAIEFWEEYNLSPWEIVLFEAQNHYVDYWRDPIASGEMPVMLPTLIQSGSKYTPLSVIEQKETLQKVTKMKKSGDLDDFFESMGIRFRTKSPIQQFRNFESFLSKVETQMADVEKKYPDLVRPPEESGYEDYVPDVAQKRGFQLDRMAYMEKRETES